MIRQVTAVRVPAADFSVYLIMLKIAGRKASIGQSLSPLYPCALGTPK